LGTEPGMAGVTVTLSGKDFLGNAVNLTTVTGANGQYTFTNLLPSDPVTRYRISEAQPAGFLNGKATTPSGNFSGTIGGGSSVGTVVKFNDAYMCFIIGRVSMLAWTHYNYWLSICYNTV